MITMGTGVKRAGWIIAAAIGALVAAGCGKHPSGKAAAEQLEKSFEKSDASMKQEVVQAAAALQTSNYTQAITIMDRVVQVQPIDEAQKKAVDALIIQARQAVQQNPKLNSPELYKALSELMVRVHGEN